MAGAVVQAVAHLLCGQVVCDGEHAGQWIVHSHPPLALQQIQKEGIKAAKLL